ncbi:hypothetical protein Dda_1061 [Drechslerella dactyloides]|uniref:Uncharacterized protein n=1 Tax=Drechslerella dactyloides TaxID=74499 RepID=A0AAD6NPG6_DREDA|nr:hypothetical protein Dda_1061 [Drechslerella dactyloides]
MTSHRAAPTAPVDTSPPPTVLSHTESRYPVAGNITMPASLFRTTRPSRAKITTSPAAQSGTVSAGSCRQNGILRSILFPLVALGLSTPIISHTICFIGSRILKYRMERGARDMMISAGYPDYSSSDTTPDESSSDSSNYRPDSLISKRERQRRRIEAKIERARLKREKKLMKRYKKRARQAAKGASISNEEEWNGGVPLDPSRRRHRTAVWRWLKRKKVRFNRAMRGFKKGHVRTMFRETGDECSKEAPKQLRA